MGPVVDSNEAMHCETFNNPSYCHQHPQKIGNLASDESRKPIRIVYQRCKAEALVSAKEDPWKKIIRETFEKDGIKKERENKASSNVVTPAKGLRNNQANDYDDVYFNEETTKSTLEHRLNIETRQKYPHRLNQVVTWWQWGGPFEEMRLLTKTIFVNEALRSWIRDNLKDLKPEFFYKEFAYSHNSRKQAEEKLHELLTEITKENNSVNRKRAKSLLDNFEPWTQSINCERYWLDVEASLGRSAHEVVGRISAYNTIKHFTRKINSEEEDLNEFQPPSKKVKNDEPKQPQTPENKIITDPENNPLFARSNYEPSSDGSWRPECEDEEYEGAEEYEKNQESKPKLFWFVGPGEINIKGKIHNKWILDEINISDIFFQFRQSAITKAIDGSIEGMSEILALNHIFLIQDSESGRIIDKQLWDRVIQQVYQEYPPPDPPEDWLSKCNEVSKMARKDFKNSKSLLKNWYKSSNKESDDIIFDVFHNILSLYTPSGSAENLHEDSFAHKVLSPVISPFFKDSLEISSVWANEILDSSAHRKKRFDPSLEGRKPDFELHISMNQRKENLLVLEIKPTNHARPNKDTLNDLVKLANELKDCIDKIINDGISDNVTVCGILVEGCKCTFYIMDLQYDALYRMIQLGVFYLPRDRHDFCVINNALEVLLHAQDIVKQSATYCLAHLRGQHSSSSQTSLNRKLMQRKSFHTPMKVPPQSWEVLRHLEDQCKSPSVREQRKKQVSSSMFSGVSYVDRHQPDEE
ncbi:1962_t:CDS:10 [Funneliformis mosseae]|uniref:1962_t:CDS:1 n=1 Tax=Funneliformis mosseae TaxID=27381 RepID=A0A9N9CV19_FUNMO|nr:1962_t:CDS:10 [Funneliformis mosseae]